MRFLRRALFAALPAAVIAHGDRHQHARQNPPPTTSFTFKLAATNPTAVPLSEINSLQTSSATKALHSSAVAGSVPTFLSGAPALPTITGLRAADYPAPDKPAPTDSPEVLQWIQEVKDTGVVIPEMSLNSAAPGTGPLCSATENAAAAANSTARCWWTCGGCTRASDVADCPTKMDWGLTFDDGPAPYTPNLMEYLDEQKIKATFFVVGSRVFYNWNTLQTQYMGQHQIAIHTWSHYALTTLTNEQIIAELGWSKKIIKDVLGVTPNMMRPPYGDIDDRVRAISYAMGLTPVMWTRLGPNSAFNTNDFDIHSGSVTVQQSLAGWKSVLDKSTTIDTGFIALEHDIWQQTVEVATGYILPDAIAHQPPFKIQPVVNCLARSLSDAYIETNNNATNTPVFKAAVDGKQTFFIFFPVFVFAHNDNLNARHNGVLLARDPPTSSTSTVPGTGSTPAVSSTPLPSPTFSFSLAATNPTAVPLSEINAAQPSTGQIIYTSTAAFGSTPTFLPGAPPLPSHHVPPTDSPEVIQWIQDVKNSGVVIPNFAPTDPSAGCGTTNAAAAADTSRCWWSCGGCNRTSDITQCPTALDWGLTYDDGPAPYTPNLVNYLDEQKLKATFFVVGSRVYQHPVMLQSQYMGQHQIAVHTWSHAAPLTSLTNEQVIAELGWSKKIIKDVIGVTPNMMRPPYGDIDDRVRAISLAMGLTPVMWTRISPISAFDTGDFNIAGNTTSVQQVLQNWETIVANADTMNHGFIVLEHDLFEQSVEVATGYILPDALNRKPAFKIKPVINCLGKDLADAYIETNNNGTNLPPFSAALSAGLLSTTPVSSVAAPTGSTKATGASDGAGGLTGTNSSNPSSDKSTGSAITIHSAMGSLLSFVGLVIGVLL
ncbi:hypothetical protein CVT25_015426 [Psilocybe cyanescens]|uniref:chitin deacetylase n=1 Tax=Psilocybe cyanescens TaxID=93625 RepID=A0A409WHJ7_PSICY|nr:hypothetical protein CVT25_015426 [Psilocybe cyanescens]